LIKKVVDGAPIKMAKYCQDWESAKYKDGSFSVRKETPEKVSKHQYSCKIFALTLRKYLVDYAKECTIARIDPPCTQAAFLLYTSGLPS
jgi:hypothetical protein